jgi:hypothetical protein
MEIAESIVDLVVGMTNFLQHFCDVEKEIVAAFG